MMGGKKELRLFRCPGLTKGKGALIINPRLMTPSATHTIRMPQTLSAASLSLLRPGESWNKLAISAIEKEVAVRRGGADVSSLTTTIAAALDMARQLEQKEKGGEM